MTAPCSAGTERLRVFVSVLPLQTFVEKVGGEHVDVHAMVRPGFNPHSYDPTAQQIAALSEAELYVRAGVPFEAAWMNRIRSANRKMQVLDLRAGLDLREMDAHDADGHSGPGAGQDRTDEHRDTGGGDPHVWTDPSLVKQMAAGIRDKLSELDPAHQKDFRENYEAFAAELYALDCDIRLLLDDLPSRRFMVFHPSWGYFAEAYGLTQVPIENEGKEPGPRALAALIEQAKREQVKVVFVQPQFDKKSAAQVARAIGGRVLAIDPLAPDYSANLRRVAQQIAGVVKK
jgi:zinc transport system substrate-binding protein